MGLMVHRWTQCSRSRPEARCRSFGRSVSPGRFPNPPCPLLSSGLSTSPVFWLVLLFILWPAMGLGSLFPGTGIGWC
jgi:hypothetical protein